MLRHLNCIGGGEGTLFSYSSDRRSFCEIHEPNSDFWCTCFWGALGANSQKCPKGKLRDLVSWVVWISTEKCRGMQHASRTEQWATSYASCHSRPKSVPWRQRCIWRGSMPAARLIAWCAGTSDSESRHSHSPRVASSLAFACPLDASVLMQSSSLCLENAAYFSRLGLSTSANLRQPSKGQWNTENPSPRLFFQFILGGVKLTIKTDCSMAHGPAVWGLSLGQSTILETAWYVAWSQ